MAHRRARIAIVAALLSLALGGSLSSTGCGGIDPPDLDEAFQVGPAGVELEWSERNLLKVVSASYSIRRSDDGGMSWTPVPIPSVDQSRLFFFTTPIPSPDQSTTRFIDATVPTNSGTYRYVVDASYRLFGVPDPVLRTSLPRDVTLSASCTSYCGPDPVPVLDALAQIANNTVDVDWSDAAGETLNGYGVERRPLGGAWTPLIPDSSRNEFRRYTDASVPSNSGDYEYRVVADHFRASSPVAVTLAAACQGYCVGYDQDRDADGVLDWNDNCVAVANATQDDADADGIGDSCDAPPNFDAAITLTAHPTNYEKLADDIADAIANGDAGTDSLLLYLRQGRYYVDNSEGPIVLANDKPLYLYGAGRGQVEIRGTSNAHPIFEIQDQTGPERHVLLSGFKVMREQGDSSTIANMIGIRSTNSSQMHLDLVAVEMSDVGVEIQGAGFVRIQATSVGQREFVQQGLLVDHPEADVFMIGGGVGGGGHPPVAELDPTQVSNARQKQGRLRMYTPAGGGTRGPGDVWLETSSKYGAHVIADYRSEGGNPSGYECGDPDPFNPGSVVAFSSQFLYVPETEERVDVVVKGALSSWQSIRVDANEPVRTALCAYLGLDWALAEYSSPGRLWMIGNQGYGGSDYVVKGFAPGAHVLTAGNIVRSPLHGPLDVLETGSVVSVGDMGTYNFWCADEFAGGALGQAPCIVPGAGNPQYPQFRFMAPDANGVLTFDTALEGATPPELLDPNHVPTTFESNTEPVVAVPKGRIPKPMDRPIMNAALPGMIDVTLLESDPGVPLPCLQDFPSQGLCQVPAPAVPTDGTSDWAAIQFALNHGVRFGTVGSLVYFPAGDYCIDQTLYWNHAAYTRSGQPYGLYTGGMPPVPNTDKDDVWSGGQGGTWAGAGSGLTTLRFDTNCDGTPEPGDLFRTQRMVRQVVQGMVFEAQAGGTHETFWVEDYTQRCNPVASCPAIFAADPTDFRLGYAAPIPFNFSPTVGLVFDDVVFSGGNIAYAMGLHLGAQQSENMWVHNVFENANTGILIKASNNLNNVVYESLFDQNTVAASGLDVSLIGATILGSETCINASSLTWYLYDIDDGTGCSDELMTSSASSYNNSVQILFENTPALSPPSAQYNLGLNGSFILLHSHAEAPINLNFGSPLPQDSLHTSASLLGLHSTVDDPPEDEDLFVPNHDLMFDPGTGAYNPAGAQMRSRLD